MNKWIAIPVITVLAIAVIVTGYFVVQQANKLREAESEIVALEDSASTLEDNVSLQEGKLTDLEAKLSTLETDLNKANDDVKLQQKLVGTGFLGSAVGVYWETGFTFTNPDCVSEITIERISIIKNDGTVIYEGKLLRFSWDEESGKFVGTPWLEPMKPHEIRSIELDQYMQEPPPESLPPDMYTVEIFWTKRHQQGLPLIGSSSTVVLEVDGVKITGITGWYANEMVNMAQALEPEDED